MDLPKDYIYLIVIGVLFIMLIGSNVQYQNQIEVLQTNLQATEDIMSHTVMVLNARQDDLKLQLNKSEAFRDYMLGIWGRGQIPPTKKNPRGTRTMDFE
jgi:hypothetical protein